MDKIKLKNKSISKKNRCFIIGEAGINHDGSLSKARELVDVAVDAGVDAVKFQMFTSSGLFSSTAFSGKGLKKKDVELLN